MKARLVMPVLAAACVSLLSCDRVPTAARNPGGPSFITNGALDGNAHPAVVLIIMDIAGKPAFRCSGTIIAPKLVLTAGHCAGEPGEFSGLRIFNEADVQDDPTYPNPGGPNTIEATAWHAHPLFTESAFFLHDVGVVLLSKAVKLSAGQYGKLPTQDQLDALKPSSATVFTAVGYGLQEINPVHIESVKIRMFAEPHLIHHGRHLLRRLGRAQLRRFEQRDRRRDLVRAEWDVRRHRRRVPPRPEERAGLRGAIPEVAQLIR